MERELRERILRTEPEYTTFRASLRQKRLEYGLSRRDIGDILGVSTAAVGLMERGLCSMKLHHALRLMAFFNFEVKPSGHDLDRMVQKHFAIREAKDGRK